jgi:hypothetical protein
MAAGFVDTLESGLRRDSVAEDAYVVGSSWSADPDYHLRLHRRLERSHQHPQSQPQLGAAGVSIEVVAADPNNETLASAIKTRKLGAVNRMFLPPPQLSVGWLLQTPNSAELSIVPGDTLPIPEQEYPYLPCHLSSLNYIFPPQKIHLLSLVAHIPELASVVGAVERMALNFEKLVYQYILLRVPPFALAEIYIYLDLAVIHFCLAILLLVVVVCFELLAVLVLLIDFLLELFAFHPEHLVIDFVIDFFVELFLVDSLFFLVHILEHHLSMLPSRATKSKLKLSYSLSCDCSGCVEFYDVASN